jgi:hypothetical protein
VSRWETVTKRGESGVDSLRSLSSWVWGRGWQRQVQWPSATTSCVRNEFHCLRIIAKSFLSPWVAEYSASASHLHRSCYRAGLRALSHRPYKFPSLLTSTGQVTAGQGLEALRPAGKVPNSLIFPLQSRTHCFICSSHSVTHSGDTYRLILLLPLQAQTERPVQQVGIYPAHWLKSSLQLAAALGKHRKKGNLYLK